MRGSVSPAWLLVGLLPLLVAGITLDPARIDDGNFGPTWAQYVRERDTTPPALALYAAFALSALATAAWVWRALGTRGARIAAAALAAVPVGFATIGAATFFVPSAVLLMLWLIIVSANAAGPRRAAVSGG